MSTSYVRFSNPSNNSVYKGAGTDGWTPVESDDFDTTLSDELTQAQASGTTPTISIPVADSGVAVQVEAATAAGTPFQVEVASYNASGDLTSDYVLTLASITADQDTNLYDGGTVHTFTLEASGYTSTTTTYDSSGNATTTAPSGYDFATHTPTSTPAPSAPTSSSGPAASANTDAHQYTGGGTYLAFKTSDGSYIATETNAGLEKSTYYLPASQTTLGAINPDLEETADFTSGLTLNGTSNTASFSFSDLATRLSPLLFQSLCANTPLQSAEVIDYAEPVNQTGGIVSDSLFKNITVTGVTYQLGDGGADGRVYQFQPSASTYTTSHETQSGAATIGTVSLATPASGTAGVQATLNEGGGNDYAMTIGSGSTATTTAISSAMFSVQRVSQSNSGAVSFSNLTVTFDTAPSLAVQAALAAQAASPDGHLSIAQSRATGGASPTYDTLKFVTSTSPSTPTMNNDGSYTYTYDVIGFQEVFTPPPEVNEMYAPTESAQWNKITNLETGQTTVEEACYCTGTHIRTVHGDVAVEDLALGDTVVTASGALRPIRWLGHRTLRPAERAKPHDAHPVRISAHAFAPNQPARDLFLSPGHPVLVGADEDNDGGHLVPIMCLINGTTVRREPVDEVTYWHVELDEHDILLAENLPAESYIDLGSRPWFAGADGVLYDPDLALPEMPGRCRPVAIDGPMVEAERRRLDRVFATHLAAACAWPGAGDLLLAM